MGQLSVELSAKMESVKTKTPSKPGISFPRFFTSRLEPGKTPYDDVQWETRTASIGNDKGSVIFEQRDMEAPVDWSQTATNIVASKYFYGKLGSPERETSVGQPLPTLRQSTSRICPGFSWFSRRATIFTVTA